MKSRWWCPFKAPMQHSLLLLYWFAFSLPPNLLDPHSPHPGPPGHPWYLPMLYACGLHERWLRNSAMGRVSLLGMCAVCRGRKLWLLRRTVWGDGLCVPATPPAHLLLRAWQISMQLPSLSTATGFRTAGPHTSPSGPSICRRGLTLKLMAGRGAARSPLTEPFN